MAKLNKSTETESRVLNARGWGVDGKWRVAANRYGVTFEGDENVPKLIVVIVA